MLSVELADGVDG
jgi:hypothetical protein